MIATFNVWVCRFGVSLYSSIASMPLSRFTPHLIRGRRLYRSTNGPKIRPVSDEWWFERTVVRANGPSRDGVQRSASLQVDESHRVPLGELKADVGSLPGIASGQRRDPDRQPVRDRCAVSQPHFVRAWHLVCR